MLAEGEMTRQRRPGQVSILLPPHDLIGEPVSPDHAPKENKKAAAVSRGGSMFAEGSSTNKTAAIAGGCCLRIIVMRRFIPSLADLAATYSRAS
jgi:hypothetical protein